MPEAFDPYYVWLAIPPHEQPPNCYRLLGVPLLESNPRVIDNAADRQMAHLRTLQTGANGVLAQRLLNEVSAARVTLLDPRKKGEYDRQLQARGVAPARVPSARVAGAGPQRSPGGPVPKPSSRRLSDRTITILAVGIVLLAVVAGIGRLIRLRSVAERILPPPRPADTFDKSANQAVLDFHEWSSSADDFGTKNEFRQEGSEWVELKNGNVWAHFTESNRTPDYVELYDAGRNVWVRLTLTDASWSRDQTHWQVTAHGGPVRSP